MRPTFALAPNFQSGGGWTDRLLVAERDGWRAPREDELAGLVAPDPLAEGAVCLFVMPGHLRAKFWAMLGEEAAEGTGDFIGFAEEVRQFLTFKELPPPADAVFELVVQDVGGEVKTAGLWSLVNFSDEPVLLAWPGVRLSLTPGAGCRLDFGFPPAVVPPAEEPAALLAIRIGAAADESPHFTAQ
jgi:hypothetical protein